MEFVIGFSLLELDPDKCTREQRLRVSKDICVALTALLYHGVRHCDEVPSNIMICGTGSSIPTPEALSKRGMYVKIIDMGIVDVLEYLGETPRCKERPPDGRKLLPISPLYHFWDQWPSIGPWIQIDTDGEEGFNAWLRRKTFKPGPLERDEQAMLDHVDPPFGYRSVQKNKKNRRFRIRPCSIYC